MKGTTAGAATISNHILIVGAGIGGLALALALQRAGFQVQVLEQATELQAIGAGVSLAPNATRSLASLGVLEQVLAHGHVPDGAAIKHYSSGAYLSRYEMGAELQRRWGAPYVQIHRAALQSILTAAVLDNDADAIQLGRRVVAFREDSNAVTVATTHGDYEAGFLVAADGARSAIRAQLHGEAAPHYLGYAAWRGLAPAESISMPLEPDTALFIGPKRSLLRYLLAGRTQVNIVMFSQHDSWTEEDWTVRADPTEIRETFRGWTPEAHELVEAVCRHGVYKWGLFGRPPLSHWGRGRITLIGDAAHPMLPFLGQGAALAIEDAVLLSRAFAIAPYDTFAMRMYEQARFERATAAVSRANKQGLQIHGYIVDADDGADVPTDDFAEFGFNAATVPLPGARC